MNDKLHVPVRHKLLDHDRFAWLVLVIMLFVTLVLWQLSERQIERSAQDRFLYLANKEGNVILTRMQAYEQVLRGGAALFAASVHVNRAEWSAYIEQLELASSLPGIQGTGFALAIPPGEREAHELEVRAAGFSDYQISPSGDRELLTSILYLEPFDLSNRRAFGYDMYSEPVRRAAMSRARDSGKAALSSKVTLLQESNTDIQPGFLMYLPVYHNGSAHDDVNSRRTALYGFVFSPFRAHDLMSGILQTSGRDLELELFDGEPDLDNLLYRSVEMPLVTRYVTDVKLQIAGRLWTARVHSSQSFESGIASTQSLLILAAGCALDFTLFAMLLINARHRRRMRVAAVALEQSRDSFRTLVENVPGTVFRSEAEAPWVLEHISPGIEALIGEPTERFVSGEIHPRQFTHSDDMGTVVDAIQMAVAEHDTYSVEYRINLGDNCIRWVTERGRASYNAAGQPQWLDGVILDVTTRKEAELAVRDLAFVDPLTGLPNRRLLIDRLTQQIATTHRSKRYDALLIEVAHRLLSNVRESDTVTRIGGDEFVLILVDLADSDIQARLLAEQIVEKLVSALNQAYQLGGHTQYNSPSIGITLFSGHEATVEELLRRADQAMYSAKKAGRNRIKFYESISAS